MQTLNRNIILNQGADFSLVIQINGDAGPIDISDYSFSSVMKTSTSESAMPVATFTFSILNQATNKGQVTWSMPSATTADIIASIVAASQGGCRPTTPYIYDVLMVDNVNQSSRIIQGLILVSPQVTEVGEP